MQVQEMIDLASRCAEVLRLAGREEVKKDLSKKKLLELLGATDLSAEDVRVVEDMPVFSAKYLEAITKAEAKGQPLLRNPTAPATADNTIRETDTYNLFLSLLRFKLTAASAKPGPKPANDPWFETWRVWMESYSAFFKASGFAERAGLTAWQVSALINDRSTTAATAERKQALHSAFQTILAEALQTLPPLDDGFEK